MSQTYSLTFRGTVVRFRGGFKSSWTSVYGEQHVLLTYPTVDTRVPVIEHVVRTAATLRKEVKDRPALRQWEGQSFIVRVTPGTTEITEAEVVE